MELMWTPGKTGLCIEIPEAFPVSISRAPTDEAAVVIEPRHITLLRRASLVPIIDELTKAWNEHMLVVPPIPPLRLDTDLCLATRPPHPEKDPPDCVSDRKTWFVAVLDQTLWSLWLDLFVEQINQALGLSDSPWPNPETERFFHVSIFNNRHGDPFRSVGDINLNDTTVAWP